MPARQGGLPEWPALVDEWRRGHGDLRLDIRVGGAVSASVGDERWRWSLPSSTPSWAADAIAPLAALGEDHIAGFVYRFCSALAAQSRGHLARSARDWEGILARLEQPTLPRGMPEGMVVHYRAGALLAYGVKATWCDGDEALRIADRLEQLGLKLYEMSADQLRAGGTAALAIMLDGTLRELHEARAEAAPSKAALAKMPTLSEVRAALSAVGLTLLTEESADETQVFASPRDVLESLRVQGLTAGHLARGSTPLTRGEFARLEQNYADKFSVNGVVAATYRVGYFIARKP